MVRVLRKPPWRRTRKKPLRYVYVGSGEGVLIVNAAEEGSDGPGADDDRYVTYAVSGGTLSAPHCVLGARRIRAFTPRTEKGRKLCTPAAPA